MNRRIITFLLLFVIIIPNISKAQTDSLPKYKKYPSIPAFNLMLAPDSIPFSNKDLKHKKPTLIMIFNPECSHCQLAIKALLEKENLFRKTQVIMASPTVFKNIRDFCNEQHIVNYPQFKMGRESNYFLGSFYEVTSFPTLVLYNKKGKFVEMFNGHLDFEKIAEKL